MTTPRYKCRSYLDDARNKEWPSDFVAVPQIGQSVKAVHEDYLLRVTGITHTMVPVREADNRVSRYAPQILVDLGK